MRVDIYRRAEHDGIFSHLAVPEDKIIPEEVTSTDWELELKAHEIADDATDLPDFHIGKPLQQIAEKGYAITSLKDM